MYETYKHRVNIPALSSSAHLPVSAHLVYLKIILNNVVKFQRPINDFGTVTTATIYCGSSIVLHPRCPGGGSDESHDAPSDGGRFHRRRSKSASRSSLTDPEQDDSTAARSPGGGYNTTASAGSLLWRTTSRWNYYLVLCCIPHILSIFILFYCILLYSNLLFQFILILFMLRIIIYVLYNYRVSIIYIRRVRHRKILAPIGIQPPPNRIGDEQQQYSTTFGLASSGRAILRELIVWNVGPLSVQNLRWIIRNKNIITKIRLMMTRGPVRSGPIIMSPSTEFGWISTIKSERGWGRSCGF